MSIDIDTADDAVRELREQNDAFRRTAADLGPTLAGYGLVITAGIAARSSDFIQRALECVRDFDAFTPDSDPWGEHDFGSFVLDGAALNWKIDYYDLDLEHGSPDPRDPAVTRRVLTLMLADEY